LAQPVGLLVLSLAGERIAELTWFLGPLVPAFPSGIEPPQLEFFELNLEIMPAS
jgi:hypothetical protein